MTKSLTLVGIENSIERLNLPAFHPRAFPLTERRRHYLAIVDSLAELYDYSAIDEFAYGQLSCLALTAYVHGGL